MSLYDENEAKRHLGITGNAENAFLNQVGPQCESALLRRLKRQVEQKTFTEFYSGTGTQTLFLRHTPVQSITTIHVNSGLYYGAGDAETSSDLLTAGTDYALDVDQNTTGPIDSMSGMVFRINGVWSRPTSRIGDNLAGAPGLGIGNVKVVYVAGWPEYAIPEDIKLALHQMIAIVRANAQDGGQYQSESLDYWSGSKFDPSVLSKAVGSVDYLIAPYRALVV